MSPSPIIFMLFLIVAIFIEYFLFRKWQRYKNPGFTNNSDEIFLGKFNWLQFVYYAVLAAIGIIQIATYIFESYLWMGGLIYLLLAMLGFARNIILLEGAASETDQLDQKEWDESPPSHQKRAGLDSNTTVSHVKYLWVVVFILQIFSIFSTTSHLRSPAQEQAGAVTWIASIFLGLMIVFWKPTGHKSTAALKTRPGPGEIWFLSLIVILSFFVRAFLLAEHPYPLSGDEASIAIVSRQILNGETGSFFNTAWASQPVWSFLPTSLSTKVFGDNIVGIRATSVIAGTLAVLFTYLAAKEMFNPKIAMISTAFLATFPYHVHFSRLGVGNIMDSLMSSLVFWLIARSVGARDIRWCYLAGAFSGLCFYTYAGTKLVPFLGMITLLFFLYNKQDTSLNRIKYILFFITAAAISASPQIASLTQDRNLLLGRLGQEGILFNGWLTEQTALQEISVIEILWNQFTRTFLAFIALPSSGIFYYSPKPHLTIAASIFFLFGHTYSWIQRAKPQYFSLLIWYWIVVILGGVLTKDPPANTRMLMTTPAIAIFIGIGIHQLTKHLMYSGILSQFKLLITTFAIIALLSVQNIYFYMFEFKDNSYFQDAAGEFSMEAGTMIKNLGDKYQVFIIGDPIVYSDFPTFKYFAPHNQITNLNDQSIQELQLTRSKKYVFFAIPESHMLLEKVMERYPGGQKGAVTRKIRQRPVLYEYYILDYK